jgi:hypothetical protein
MRMMTSGRAVAPGKRGAAAFLDGRLALAQAIDLVAQGVERRRFVERDADRLAADEVHPKVEPARRTRRWRRSPAASRSEGEIAPLHDSILVLSGTSFKSRIVSFLGP